MANNFVRVVESGNKSQGKVQTNTGSTGNNGSKQAASSPSASNNKTSKFTTLKSSSPKATETKTSKLDKKKQNRLYDTWEASTGTNNTEPDVSALYGDNSVKNAATRVGHASVGAIEKFIAGMGETGGYVVDKYGKDVAARSFGNAFTTQEERIVALANQTKGINEDHTATDIKWDDLDDASRGQMARYGVKTEDEYNAIMSSYASKKESHEKAYEENAASYEDKRQNGIFYQTMKKLRNLGDQRIAESTAGMKDGIGKTIVQAIPSLVSMYGDAQVGGINNSLNVMLGRIFGETYSTARDDGYDDEKAARYAITSAAIEYATELIGGESVVGKLYGNKGAFSSPFNKIIAKISSKTLAKVALVINGGVEEGVEEIASELASPLADAFLSDKDYFEAVEQAYGDKFSDKSQLRSDLANAFVGGFVTNLLGAPISEASARITGRQSVMDAQLEQIGFEKVYGAERAEAINNDIDNTINIANGDNAKAQSWSNLYNEFSGELNSVTSGSVLYGADGKQYGVVKAPAQNGFVIDLESGKSETIVRFSNGQGYISPESETATILRSGGTFSTDADYVADRNARNEAGDTEYDELRQKLDDTSTIDEYMQAADEANAADPEQQRQAQMQEEAERAEREQNRREAPQRPEPTNYEEAIKQASEDNKYAFRDLVQRANSGIISREEFDVLKANLDAKHQAAIKAAEEKFGEQRDEAMAKERADSLASEEFVPLTRKTQNADNAPNKPSDSVSEQSNENTLPSQENAAEMVKPSSNEKASETEEKQTAETENKKGSTPSTTEKTNSSPVRRHYAGSNTILPLRLRRAIDTYIGEDGYTPVALTKEQIDSLQKWDRGAYLAAWANYFGISLNSGANKGTINPNVLSQLIAYGTDTYEGNDVSVRNRTESTFVNEDGETESFLENYGEGDVSTTPASEDRQSLRDIRDLLETITGLVESNSEIITEAEAEAKKTGEIFNRKTKAEQNKIKNEKLEDVLARYYRGNVVRDGTNVEGFIQLFVGNLENLYKFPKNTNVRKMKIGDLLGRLNQNLGSSETNPTENLTRAEKDSILNIAFSFADDPRFQNDESLRHTEKEGERFKKPSDLSEDNDFINEMLQEYSFDEDVVEDEDTHKNEDQYNPARDVADTYINNQGEVVNRSHASNSFNEYSWEITRPSGIFTIANASYLTEEQKGKLDSRNKNIKPLVLDGKEYYAFKGPEPVSFTTQKHQNALNEVLERHQKAVERLQKALDGMSKNSLEYKYTESTIKAQQNFIRKLSGKDENGATIPISERALFNQVINKSEKAGFKDVVTDQDVEQLREAFGNKFINKNGDTTTASILNGVPAEEVDAKLKEGIENDRRRDQSSEKTLWRGLGTPDRRTAKDGRTQYIHQPRTDAAAKGLVEAKESNSNRGQTDSGTNTGTENSYPSEKRMLQMGVFESSRRAVRSWVGRRRDLQNRATREVKGIIDTSKDLTEAKTRLEKAGYKTDSGKVSRDGKVFDSLVAYKPHKKSLFDNASNHVKNAVKERGYTVKEVDTINSVFVDADGKFQEIDGDAIIAFGVDGVTTIYGQSNQIIDHETYHGDIKILNEKTTDVLNREVNKYKFLSSDGGEVGINDFIKENLKEFIDNAVSSDGRKIFRYKTFINDLVKNKGYSIEEAPEELFVELASCAKMKTASEFDNDMANYTALAEALQFSENDEPTAFVDFADYIERVALGKHEEAEYLGKNEAPTTQMTTQYDWSDTVANRTAGLTDQYINGDITSEEYSAKAAEIFKDVVKDITPRKLNTYDSSSETTGRIRFSDKNDGPNSARYSDEYDTYEPGDDGGVKRPTENMAIGGVKRHSSGDATSTETEAPVQLDEWRQKAIDSSNKEIESAGRKVMKSLAATDRKAFNGEEKVKERYNEFRKDFASMTAGVKTVSDFVDSFKKIRDSSDLGVYYGEVDKNTGMSYFEEQFSNLAEQQKKALETPEGSDARIAYAKHAARLISSYAQYVDDVNNVLRKYSSKMVNEAKKNASKNANNGKLTRELAQYYKRMQISADNVFKGLLGGYNKNSVSYEVAEMHKRAVAKNISLQTEMKSYFAGIKESKEMQSILSNEQKSGIKFTSVDGSEVELSTAEMMDAILNLRTLAATDLGKPDWNRLAETPGMAITDVNGKITQFVKFEGKTAQEKAKWAEGKLKEMEEALSKNKAASDFFNATTEMLYDMGKQTNATHKALHGRELGMFAKGDYHTLRIVGREAKKNDAPLFGGVQDYNAMKSRGNNTGYVVVQPLNRYVDNYIQQASNYVAFAEFGRTLEIMNNSGSIYGSVGQALGEAQGKTWETWFNNYVRDINMIKETEDSSMSDVNSILRKTRNLMSQGTLLGSPSTAIKQISSRWGAMGVINPAAVSKAMTSNRVTNKEGHKLASELRKNNPFYRSRFTGNIDADVSTALNADWVQKLSQKSKVFKTWANLTNIADQWAVGKVYEACVYDIQMAYPNLDVNSKVFADAVNSKFEEALLKTQPIFTKQARAEYHRTDNEIIRSLSMFRTQQTQNFNRIMEAFGEYKAATGEEKKAAKKVRNGVIRGQLTAAVSLSALTIAADLLLHKTKKYRDDDKDDDDVFGLSLEKIAKRFGLNAIEGAAGTAWFIDDLAKWMIDKIDGNDYNGNEFYGVSLGAVSTVRSMFDAATTLVKTPSIYNAKVVAGYVSQMYGIPLNNVYNIMNGMIMWTKEITGSNDKEYDDAIKALQGALGDKGNKLYRYYLEGKGEKAQKTLESMGNDYKSIIKDESMERLKKGTASIDEIEFVLENYADMTRSETETWLRNARGYIDTGYKDSTAVKDEFVKGKIAEDNAIDYLVSYQGKTAEAARKQVAEWQFSADFEGMSYSKMEHYYQIGKFSDDEAVDILTRYGSMTADAAKAKVKEWAYEEDTGVDYSELSSGYISGDYSDSEIIKARMDMAGDSKEEATQYLNQLKFKQKYGKTYTNLKQMYRDGEISANEAKSWYEKIYGSDGSNWLAKQELWKKTGYESSTTFGSTFNDSYATKEKIGANTFYNKHGSEFKKPSDFGTVMMAIDNRYDVDADETKYVYNPSKGWGASKGQAGAIELLNKYISNGTISYQLAYEIWTEYCGWSAKSSNAWQYVKR